MWTTIGTLAVLLICPLMMVFMMRGMHGNHSNHGNHQHGAGEGDDIQNLRQRIAELEHRVHPTESKD